MNIFTLFKKLLPGFLPLIIFIIADNFLGTKISLIVAVAFGCIEFLFTYLKNKIIDQFILLDTALLFFLGLISFLLNNDIFFKLKPAVIELIFCIILGISAFSRYNILFLMSKRYMKDINMPEHQVNKLQQSIRVFFFIFIIHTLLIIYSAYYMSKEAWAFISSALLYILLGLYFIIEMIKTRLFIYHHKQEEWLPLVDTEGKITGQAPRSVCHQKRGMLHPVVHLHVLNSKKQVLLQKRPLFKEIQPGKWDTAVGGHVSIQETLEQALFRETFEEIGIKEFKPILVHVYQWQTDIESELVYMFITFYDGEFKAHPEEVTEIKFWSQAEILKELDMGIFTPNFQNEFKLLEKTLNTFKL